MPLSAQEERCVALTLPLLGIEYGGDWRFSRSLDDAHNSEPSPECVVSNGKIDAAVEVKRLTGDEIDRAYDEAIHSLHRSLVPSCGGYYMLAPAIDLRLPIDGRLKRRLKSEIERVAKDLEPGGNPGAILLPREAMLHCAIRGGPGQVRCHHNSTVREVLTASSQVTGAFLLRDGGQLEHKFVTEEGRQAFQKALVDACQGLDAGESVTVQWVEEWPLHRTKETEGDDHRHKDGVWVLCSTDVRELSSSVAEAVETIVFKAAKKFEKRWAAEHIVVLDKADVFSTLELVNEALSWMDRSELANIDLVVFVQSDLAEVVWQRNPRSLAS